MRSVWLIARSVLIEAIRRKEIYAIVLVSVLLIGAVMTIDFFGLDDIQKFYREIALQLMSFATAITVIVLAARQLPREFETRTIYPLLAKPLTRLQFLAGKLLGVMLAAAFCFALFMAVYLAGSLWLGHQIPVGLFIQFIILQMLMMAVVASLSFWLSMLLNLDAAITISTLLYLSAALVSKLVLFMYDYMSALQQFVLKIYVFLVPQLYLFDLSQKAVHGDEWEPVAAWVMLSLVGYAALYTGVFFTLALMTFRRKAL